MPAPQEKSRPKNTALTRSTLDFPVVGIGASAGGLRALMTFFEHMPTDCGMAFVVIMHLSPKHESNIDHILQNVTRLPALQVNEPVQVEKNRIYVIPPGMDLSMNDGYLRLAKPDRASGPQVAIDLFFRALADVHHTHAVGIVLSGTGADGSVGLSRIKEQGGITIAQSPEDAEYESMPRAAIDTGIVDIVLPVAEMPQRLLELGANMKHLIAPNDAADDQAVTPTELPKTAELALRDILALLRARTGHDFRHYKQATVLRRIERRLQVNGLRDMQGYGQFLRENPVETKALLADMLIGVTNFFRDREAFEALERDVIPNLFDPLPARSEERDVRVWSAACATGEEAYSLAMLLTEYTEANDVGARLHVFATDIDERALEVGRSCTYPEAIVTDVPPSRLRRFFSKEGTHYRLKKELRENILFARHNVLRDPPFSRLDLISCRNLLIYLDRDIQSEVLRIFHFALKPGGYLFLGSSETAEACAQLFTPVDKKHRIYQAKETVPALRNALVPIAHNTATERAPERRLSDRYARSRRFSFADVHQRVLEQYAPPSVIVNQDGDIVHMSDRAGRFLRYVGGEPSLNLATLVLPDLRLELRTALYQAAHTGKSVEARRVRLGFDERSVFINMVVRPFRDEEVGSDFMLVIFDEVEDCMDRDRPGEHEAEDSVLTQLEDELQRRKEQLQLTMEQSETSTEELRASNEELQAINEELRSATEELETSKEELQSINEELITVNAELRSKVDETSKINDDLQNLITSTDIATVFIDRNMCIKWFTPRARTIFNVIGNDTGRSLLDITHRLDYPSLHADAAAAFNELRTVEREVASAEGRWYLARMLPYRTADDRIQGAVMTFVDITARREAEHRMHAGEAHLKLLAQSTKGFAIITMDRDGLITTWNPAAESIFGYSKQEATGKSVDVLYTPEDRQQHVAEHERIRARDDGYSSDERWHLRKDGSRVYMSGLVNPLVEDGKVVGFAKIARDMTAQQLRMTAQENELESAQASSLQKDQFFAVLSHELKHPLNLIQLNTDLLTRLPVVKADPSLGKATQAIRNAVRSQSRIIDDLMDVSRIRTGKLKLNFSVVDFHELLQGVEATFRPHAEAESLGFETTMDDAPLYVNADPTRLEQIVWNLLNNAWKFTPGGGLVSVRLTRENDFARLDVIDTGSGISEEFLPKVFEMFGQAEFQHAQRARHGLGIGLALVHQLVEAHGGRIEAFSEGLGRGARFTLWLPISLETEQQLGERGNRQADGEGNLGGVRVLLVEDSVDTLDAMRMLLESEGAIVTAANSGAEGIACATEDRFDVIVSDIGMAEMDGHEMMLAIRATPNNAHTPSIALTGYGTTRDVKKAKAAGFDTHLRKPVDLDTLIDAVARAIA